MINQVQIITNPSSPTKEKGDFFEGLIRDMMETQRYKVTSQINFTGTEIDNLCDHLDRPEEKALVECKAKLNVNSEDIKNFVFDIVVTKRAKYGFFVHTSEIHHQAAGLVDELKKGDHRHILVFWGPDKIVELLQHSKHITPPPETDNYNQLLPTKRILFYTYRGHFWVTIMSNQIVATHYHVASATFPDQAIDNETLNWISQLEELRDLERFEKRKPIKSVDTQKAFDAIPEIQESEEWDDYRPVGSKFFVGRNDIRNKLYRFVQSANDLSSQSSRVFFIEGKSGWGKSSLTAQLRARSRNQRNKNSFFVIAIDSRSATTSEFVALSAAKLISKASKANFIPPEYSQVNISSTFDILVSSKMQELITWLAINKRVLVIVFDQFEDIFRKENLFRAFHKFMVDVNEQRGPFVIGFSWKSEINIPIDNPAYSLWQQSRSFAEIFYLDEFLDFEVDQVLKQLETLSGKPLPSDLKRRLREGSQGFPWLTKKLSIHCYHQMKKGLTPEELVDQNLNVEVLFNTDKESLSPNETRALNLIANRGYEGNPFDITEVDETISEIEISSLLAKRLIVRSGGKYNVYWDIFRDYLVEGKVPTFGESFLLRQYPEPCRRHVITLLEHSPSTLEEIVQLSPPSATKPKIGTIGNGIRELRNLGVVNKDGDRYRLRPNINSLETYKIYVAERLNAHIVINSLKKLSDERITHADVLKAVRDNYRGYRFSQKTWNTYANYLIAWLQFTEMNFNGRLADFPSRTEDAISFTPQMRAEKDFQLFVELKNSWKNLVDGSNRIPRPHNQTKGLYDLRQLGFISTDGKYVYLSDSGIDLSKLDDKTIRREIAKRANQTEKINTAYLAWKDTTQSKNSSFEKLLEPLLNQISSSSYREVTTNVLRAWAKFVYDELG